MTTLSLDSPRQYFPNETDQLIGCPQCKGLFQAFEGHAHQASFEVEGEEHLGILIFCSYTCLLVWCAAEGNG